MAELRLKIPDELEKEIEKLSPDKSKFNRMTENSKLSDEDCLRLGREVNEKLARRYSLVK
jgi:hypothetical protein